MPAIRAVARKLQVRSRLAVSVATERMAMSNAATATEGSRAEVTKYLPWGIAGLALWWLLYHSLAPFAAWFTYSLLSLTHGSHLGAATEFFVFESPKVLM